MEENNSQKMSRISEGKGLVLRVYRLTLTGQRKVEGGKGYTGCVGIKEALRLERDHNPNSRVSR